MQLAKTYKSNGKFKEAMDLFEAILKAQPMMLPVQIEAARSYQDWAGLSKPEFKVGMYKSAMLGARPDKTNPDLLKQNKNIIWGWGEIGKMTAGNANFRDQFHESRFNLALCRYNQALAETNAAQKTETLKMAQRDIAITVGLYSDMGGDKWRVQYDTLLKSVQKALGDPPLGLQALQSTQPATTPPATGAAAPTGTKTTAAPAAGGTTTARK
jgi:hypothetical protein